MQYGRIGQDHKDSSTESCREASWNEAGEVVHRRDGTSQSRFTVSFQFCILFADQYTKFVFVDFPEAKIEALTSL